VGIRLALKTVERLKEKVRQLTDQKAPVPLEQRVKKLSLYLTGWMGYFALADAKKILGN